MEVVWIMCVQVLQSVSGVNEELYETLQMLLSAAHSKPDLPLSVVMLETNNHGTVAQYIALSPHSKKVSGSSPSWATRPFCLKFACSLSVCLGRLWMIWFHPQFADMEDM